MENFICTRMGDKFFNTDVPQIRQALETIGEEMKKANELKGKELELKEREINIMEQIHHL